MNDTELSLKINKIAEEILTYSRNTLIVHMRFLDLALSRLSLIPADQWNLATDGDHIYYHPEYIIRRYKMGTGQSVRDYLHVLLHCIFQHPFVSGKIHTKIWDLSCDIAVENVISGLNIASAASENEARQELIFDELKKELKYLNAETIYRYYLDRELSDEQADALRAAFISDDHSVWYMPEFPDAAGPSGDEATDSSGDEATGQPGGDSKKSDNGESSGMGAKNENHRMNQYSNGLQKEWKSISEHIQEDLSTFSRRPGINAGAMLQNLAAVNRERYDYTDFLKKFGQLGEEMKVNEDEFDYIFYTYGLKLYEKIPLIEPLEYKEVKRIKEFVIAIDTSGSCSGELVQLFLQKTYNLLKQEESFFTKINLHIIQCDYLVQEDVKITSQKEFDEYLKTMTVKGLGGTDFRPVFDYVNKLQQQKEFENLKGLIYFTDGRGEFPEHQPSYKTAFVFVDDGIEEIKVPVWAIKLVLPKYDLRE